MTIGTDLSRPVRARRILAVASGGGHWVQMLRLTPALEAHETTFATVDRAAAADVAPARLLTFPDANRDTKLALVAMAVALAWIVVRVRPDVVITTGAAPGYVAVRLGKMLGARTMFIDSVANAREALPLGEARRGSCRSSPHPVAGRRLVLEGRLFRLRLLSRGGSVMRIFVTVGTQLPFDRLVRAMDDWAASHPGHEVLAQTGDGAFVARAIATVRTLSREAFARAVAEADVVVAHAGIGSVLTALDAGKPVVLMPRRADLREHRNDHQASPPPPSFSRLPPGQTSERRRRFAVALCGAAGGRAAGASAAPRPGASASAALSRPAGFIRRRCGPRRRPHRRRLAGRGAPCVSGPSARAQLHRPGSRPRPPFIGRCLAASSRRASRCGDLEVIVGPNRLQPTITSASAACIPPAVRRESRGEAGRAQRSDPADAARDGAGSSPPRRRFPSRRRTQSSPSCGPIEGERSTASRMRRRTSKSPRPLCARLPMPCGRCNPYFDGGSGQASSRSPSRDRGIRAFRRPCRRRRLATPRLRPLRAAPFVPGVAASRLRFFGSATEGPQPRGTRRLEAGEGGGGRRGRPATALARVSPSARAVAAPSSYSLRGRLKAASTP